MGEMATAVRVLVAASVGYLLIGEAAAGQLRQWFGWPDQGPLSWLADLLGLSL